MSDDHEAITATVRACFVRRDNLRISCTVPLAVPTWRALVVESVRVHESMRRQGVCKRFLAQVVNAPGYDLFIVEAVQNRHLAEYLMREDWEYDADVMDFYRWARKDEQ